MNIKNCFQVIDQIGSGSYAVVYKALVIADYQPLNIGDIVAIKSILISKFDSQEEKNKLEMEINLMKRMSHPNIIKLYGVERTKDCFYLIMEYCEKGDLHMFLKNHPNGIPPEITHNFAVQIGRGLQYLKSMEIIHRDLKPQNIMLKNDWPSTVLKIADFGFARFLKGNMLTTTICGSPIYMAPEILNKKPYTSSVDMWSLGLILYQMVTNKLPFDHCKTTIELLNELKKYKSASIQIPEIYKTCPDDLRDLISKLLTFDPKNRLTLQMYMQHPYIIKEFDNNNNQEQQNKQMMTSFIGNDSILLGKTRRKFSFRKLIKKNQFDKVMGKIKSSAETIESLFTDCQDNGESLLLDLITTMIEFLFCMLLEMREITNFVNSPGEEVIISLIREFKAEAMELSHIDLNEPKETAFQYLYRKGMQSALTAIKAEKEGDSSYASFKYSKAIDILTPLVYIVDCDEKLSQARIIYDQLNLRMTSLNNQQEKMINYS